MFALFTCLFLSSSDSISIVLFRRKDKTVNSVISCPEVCTSDVINKAGKGAPKYQIRQGPTPLCFSLVKSEPRWLHPESSTRSTHFYLGCVTTHVGHQHGHQGDIKLLGAALLCGKQQGYSYDKLLDRTTKTNTQATLKRCYPLHCYIQGLS